MNKAFTLVELAIVLTIIGLLIGGILKGQELVMNARVKATVAEVQGIKAAFISFEDVYGHLPGDLPYAERRIPGCTPGCDVSGGVGDGDGRIGLTNWNGNIAFPRVPPSNPLTHGNVNAPSVGYETMNAWTHLFLARLIGGVNDTGIRSAVPVGFGVTHPAVALGTGGFRVGYTNGTYYFGTPPSVAPINAGTIMFLADDPTIYVSSPVYDGSGHVMTPLVAEQIDAKLDDGQPATGSVRGAGRSSGATDQMCYTTATPPSYNSLSAKVVCRLFFIMD